MQSLRCLIGMHQWQTQAEDDDQHVVRCAHCGSLDDGFHFLFYRDDQRR